MGLVDDHLDEWRDATDKPMSVREALAETESLMVELEIYADCLRGDLAREMGLAE